MRKKLGALLQHLIPSGSLVQRTVKSGLWVGATKFSSRFFQMLMLIVLARLLSPEDFGLMGIALIVLAATKRFTEIGLDAALIQQKETNVDSYLDTTWCLEVARGVLIFGLLFALAPYIAAFFSEPRATPLIRVLGLGPLLLGVKNPGVVYFEKNLEFHKYFVYKAGGGFLQFVVGVGYALQSPTVWALVFGTLSRPASKVVLSYVLHDYRPWPSFNRAHALELVHFGKWITGSSIIGWIATQGDDAFVGWFLSATALGFYQYAYQMADVPARELSGVISRITFPAYSALQEETAQVRGALIQSTRFVALIAFPLGFGIALVAPSFVRGILGSEWTPMILTLQILAMYGLLHAITQNFGSLWKALGRPDLIAKTGALRILCIAVVIWPATDMWGIEGTAMAVTAVYLFPMLPLEVYLVTKMIDGRPRQLYREYFYPFVGAVVMFTSLWYARGLVELHPLVEFVVLIPAGVIVYAATALALERQFNWGIEQNIQTVINGIKG